MARLEGLAVLDEPAKAAAKAVRQALSPGAVKDALSGTWLGHPLHPVLTDTVIGTWTSALIVDLLGEEEGRAAQALIAAGILCSLPTALSGASDWADGEPADDGVRRVGAVHAASNSVALTLQVGSLLARRRGARGRGIAMSMGAAGLLGFSGMLGGHLSYVQGVGVDQTAFDPGPDDWTPAGSAGSLGGEPVRVQVDDTPVLLVRDGAAIHALHDRCSHRGCSLSEGSVQGTVIECGCHGSRFSLLDGEVLRGPATAPQPVLDVRERDGRIEVRRRPAP